MRKTPRTTYTSVDVAVTKLVAHFGAKNTKVFRAPDGEAIVEYFEEDAGMWLTRIVDSNNDDGWVAILHVKPKNLQEGLPQEYNAHFMFDTAKDWWPAKS